MMTELLPHPWRGPSPAGPRALCGAPALWGLPQLWAGRRLQAVQPFSLAEILILFSIPDYAQRNQSTNANCGGRRRL